MEKKTFPKKHYIASVFTVLLLCITLLVLKYSALTRLFQLLESNSVEKVSLKIQQKITQIQNADCKGKSFICEIEECGLDCQVSQRIGCVAMSLKLGIPFILTNNDGNAASNSILQPIGSQCKQGPNTYSLHWKSLENSRNMELRNINGNIVDAIPYPFRNDVLEIPKDLQELAESIGSNTFEFWIGQFTKYVLKLNAEVENKVRKWKKELKEKGPIVGIYIDKHPENHLRSDHLLGEYFWHASNFFEKRGWKSTKTVFLVSDNSKVFQEAALRFPALKWNILSFNANKTRASGRGENIDILRDIILLSECDFVVCGLTSSICQVAVQLMNGKHSATDAINKFKSMDGTFQVKLGSGHSLRYLKLA